MTNKVADPPVERTAGVGKVLVIDDEPQIAENLARMLRAEHYEVDIATSGAMGMEIFQGNRHDIVLTDLRLGDMSGTDVLATVKKLVPETSVIIITGYATTESAVEAIRLGANDYLTKPVRMGDLLMTVRSQMEAVKLQERVKALNQAVAEERDKLRRSVTELELLKRLAERMMSTLSYSEGFDLILNMLIEEVEADIAAVYICDRDNFRISSVAPPSRRDLEQIAELINTRGPELLKAPVVCSPERFEGVKLGDVSDGTGLLSLVILPLRQGERPFGLIVAGSRRDEHFADVWSDFIRQLSDEASEFLERVKRSVERQRLSTAAVVEHTQDGIIMIQLDSGAALLNPMARSLLAAPSTPTLNASAIGERLRVDIDEILRQLKEHQEPQGRHSTAVSAEIVHQGRPLFLRINISLLPGMDGEGALMLMVIHDVTKERQVEEMKSRLVANISHELRTPTAVVKEFISLILDGIAGPLTEGQQQYIKIIQSNVERLARLIENLLTLARADTGGFSVVLQPIELHPIISNVVDSLVVKLKKKKMRISTSLPPEIPTVYADPDAVTQILTNLIENAYKYSDEQTEVVVSVNVKGARVEVTVTDEGYGIPEDDKENIFKRFHRLVDDNDPRFQEGVGLGLSVVKDLVTRQGGEIWVQSEVGKGSAFTFSLQVATEDGELRPA